MEPCHLNVMTHDTLLEDDEPTHSYLDSTLVVMPSAQACKAAKETPPSPEPSRDTGGDTLAALWDGLPSLATPTHVMENEAGQAGFANQVNSPGEETLSRELAMDEAGGGGGGGVADVRERRPTEVPDNLKNVLSATSLLSNTDLSKEGNTISPRSSMSSLQDSLSTSRKPRLGNSVRSRLNSSGGGGGGGGVRTPSPARSPHVSPTAGPQKSPRGIPSGVPSTSSSYEDSKDLRPLAQASQSVYLKALSDVQSSEWQQQCLGLVMLRRFVLFHPNVLIGNLQTVLLAVTACLKNLRSSVVKNALLAFGDIVKSDCRYEGCRWFMPNFCRQ